MKTDYFSTFLNTVDKPTPQASVSAMPVGQATELDINAILKELDPRGGDLPLTDLVERTGANVGQVITAVTQLTGFGLVTYDAKGVRLTEQGIRVTRPRT